MRWLPVLLLLLHPSVLRAQEPEPSGQERLALAIRLYRAGQHDEARATLINMITDEDVEDMELKLEARVYLGEVLLAAGNRTAAYDAFRAILDDDRDYRIDPYEHPPDVVEFFEMARATMATGSDEPPPPPPDPIRPPPTWAPMHWTGLTPFGLHQLRQGRYGWFSVLAVGQIGTLAGTFATGIPLYMDSEGYQDEYDKLIAMRSWNWALSGAFAALWITGTVEASVRWRGDHRRAVEAWEAEHATSELMLGPGTVRWELRF
jgi:tetratricopeptide (TPR) repeat protein